LLDPLYNDLGATITGPTRADLNLGIHLFLDGAAVPSITIDTSEPGEHTIDYVAENAAGTSTSTRTVIVEPPTVEAPPTQPTPPPPTATSSATTTALATSTPGQTMIPSARSRAETATSTVGLPKTQHQ
jgi:hypothetical protein